jgi:hypothetical protein
MSNATPIPATIRAEEAARVDLAEAYARLIANRLSGMLPEGLRFEWQAPGEPE